MRTAGTLDVANAQRSPGGLAIDLFRRVLGLDDDRPPDEPAREDPPAGQSSEPAGDAPVAAQEQHRGVPCPSCGYLIDPPPTRGRRCPACHQPIVIRMVDGQPAYLTEGAIEVFDAARRADAEELAREASRTHWLHLAATVGAPIAGRSKLAAAAPTAATVDAARRLYVGAADRAVIKARREKRWADVARIRGDQAAAVFAAAGSPVPPPDDAVALHREAQLARLRAFKASGTHVELVSAGCCRACRVGDGQPFPIVQELREPRLPHVGCTKGICGCDWWIGVPERKRRRRPRPAAPG